MQRAKSDVIKAAVAYVNQFWQLSNAEFDSIVEDRFGIDHDDEDLIAALVQEGWMNSPSFEGDTRYLRDPPDRTAWSVLRHPEV